MSNILISTDVLKSLDRHEVFLLLCLVARTRKREVWLSMEQLQHITSWHWKKVLSTTARLVEKGIIENTPTDDKTGKVEVKYRIVSDMVEKIDSLTFEPA